MFAYAARNEGELAEVINIAGPESADIFELAIDTHISSIVTSIRVTCRYERNGTGLEQV